MDTFDFAQAFRQILVALPPMIMGMTLHELAHGYTAWIMGDPTAKRMGRLTLNPLAHLDPFGSFFFLFTAFTSAATGLPLILGWAKPVPINPRNFRHLRRALVLVSLAGALANLLLAFLFALVFFLILQQDPHPFLYQTCQIGFILNCTLAWFNLLPIPPLDGSKVLAGFLPASLIRPYFSLERYGMMIILFLLVTGLLGGIIRPLTALTVEGFAFIIGWII